jgi:sec-independent protein translocase protein TatC
VVFAVRARRRRIPDDGRMALADHLRELRTRLFISAIAIVVAAIVSWIFYDDLLRLLLHPLNVTKGDLKKHGLRPEAVLNGVSIAFILQAKIALVAGIIAASPVWLYQIWAFVVPGLHRQERKWTLVFLAVASPLFLAGVALGYVVMPKGLTVLLQFTPAGVKNLLPLDQYLSFVLRVLLVFGVSFEIPLFVVLLNLAGVVKGRQLGRWRAWIIFLTFLFAAVATPSTDPITMCLLAFPMVVLFLLAEILARTIDRGRTRRAAEADEAGWDDDTPSPI